MFFGIGMSAFFVVACELLELTFNTVTLSALPRGIAFCLRGVHFALCQLTGLWGVWSRTRKSVAYLWQVLKSHTVLAEVTGLVLIFIQATASPQHFYSFIGYQSLSGQNLMLLLLCFFPISQAVSLIASSGRFARPTAQISPFHGLAPNLQNVLFLAPDPCYGSVSLFHCDRLQASRLSKIETLKTYLFFSEAYQLWQYNALLIFL